MIQTLYAQAQILQRSATDPKACVWVNASAGTGKTKVLTDRILNLLLQGTKPERILCLTFTRAAAAEMAARLNKRLSQWAIADDTALATELEELIGQPPQATLLTFARTLFDLVLETPGGMKIQTIHGFCQTLLHRFPLEAGVSPSFTLLDDGTAEELLHQAEAAILSEKHPRPRLKIALERLTQQFEYSAFHALIRSLLAKHYKLAWLHNAIDPYQAIQTQLETALDCSLDETMDQLTATFCAITDELTKALEDAAHHLAQGSSTDQKRGHIIRSWLKNSSRLHNLEQYKDAFLTEKGHIFKSLATKMRCAKGPHILSVLQTEAERMLRFVEKRNRLRTLHLSHALIAISWMILEAYQSIKQERNLLDYDDLIAFSLKLLSLPDIAPWILFKLDGGLDHILIDEAQDTNIQQWRVVESLLQEFFAGIGARDSPRTLFVVGDAKQSIYSFQGADPQLFERMRHHFSNAIKAAQQPWHDLELGLSFRSTRAVLQAVDAVFQDEIAQQGVVPPTTFLRHHVFRQGFGGSVEVWPLVRTEESCRASPWSHPTQAAKHAPASYERLADVIAQRIHIWLRDGSLLESRNRPIRPSDILILAQRRTAFVDVLIRALKSLRIPVAGVDRVPLTEHLAVMDLMALGAFLLLPEDDLNLAAVLKSPFINFTEEQLFDLCYQRGDDSVWRRLQHKASADAACQQAYTYLVDLLARTDYMSPFELYAHILGSLGGRKAALSRLGPEANDFIDEFLNLALQYQNLHTASLQGFLHWLSASAPEIKREIAGSERDEVRIMTVHGAKGLQAPIVFLPDTLYTRHRKELFLWDDRTHPQNSLPLWSPPEKLDCALTRALKQQEQRKTTQESHRLLYVALTRAEDHLYICGWDSFALPCEDSWYAHINRALAPIASTQAFDFTSESAIGWKGEGLRLTCPQEIQAPAFSNINRACTNAAAPMPLWLHSRIMRDSTKKLLVNPSKMISTEETPLRSPLSIKSAEPYQKGALAHSLLHYLPDISPSQHEDACRRYLRKYAPEGLPESHEATLKMTLNILRSDAFAHFFGSSSKAEAPIIGNVNGQVISGQIDRLVVTDTEVLILDFKSNERIPRESQSIPLAYKRQMACYKKLLEQLYPFHTVRCFLLWTEGPALMELSDGCFETDSDSGGE